MKLLKSILLSLSLVFSTGVLAEEFQAGNISVVQSEELNAYIFTTPSVKGYFAEGISNLEPFWYEDYHHFEENILIMIGNTGTSCEDNWYLIIASDTKTLIENLDFPCYNEHKEAYVKDGILYITSGKKTLKYKVKQN